MNINIAGNLKRLRKQREITQEDLANFLGVSFQAVSKWECGDGYPDITTLPALANFFEVTLDELVGMNEIKDANKLEEIKRQYDDKMLNGGTLKEIRELLRGGLKIFPNNYWLLSNLVSALSNYVGSDMDEERKKNNEEAIKISERILRFCTDTEIRSRVQISMSYSLYYMGEKDKAVELAKKLPKFYETSERMLAFVLDGEEKIKQLQKNTNDLTNELVSSIRHLITGQTADDTYYTDEEGLRLSQKAIDIYKTVYEEGDFDLGHAYLRDIYINTAKIYMKQGNKDEAVKNLEEAVKHTVAFINRSDGTRKSLLANMLPGVITYMCGVNNAQITKQLIENKQFEPLKEREEIKNMLAELDKYAD